MGMRTGICPNCGSNNILISQKPQLLKNGSNSIVGWFIKLRKNGIILRHYACKDCHLLESYIDDHESLLLAMTEWDDLTTINTKKGDHDGNA